MDALDAGDSVLVAAPTGSGKTVVAEYAVARAIADGGKAFYTTPLKALSNQKFSDLSAGYGAGRVGLLTGDNAINADAPIVVMTTEVLRNMIYARSTPLDRLRYVVLDEVHYLQNPYRGAVWEEVIIHTPPEVDLVCLSATVSNAEEFADWIATVRGSTAAIIEERRPVELRNLYMVGDRSSDRLQLFPTFVDGRPNPEPSSSSADRAERRAHCAGTEPRAALHAPAGRGRRPRCGTTRCCRRSTSSSAAPGATTPSASASTPASASPRPRNASEIRDIVDSQGRRALRRRPRRARLRRMDGRARSRVRRPPRRAGAAVQGGGRGVLRRGAREGRVRHRDARRSASTCRPARSSSRRLTQVHRRTARQSSRPGEYTQLTGRAGRRGIDDVGDAIVLWSPLRAVRPGRRAGVDADVRRCARRSGRPTTWPPTWCGATRPRRPTTCSISLRPVPRRQRGGAHGASARAAAHRGGQGRGQAPCATAATSVEYRELHRATERRQARPSVTTTVVAALSGTARGRHLAQCRAGKARGRVAVLSIKGAARWRPPRDVVTAGPSPCSDSGPRTSTSRRVRSAK